MRAIWTGLGPILALFCSPVSAQETRMGKEGFESPPATLAQMDWLIGQWSGDGIRGAPAMESWLPPTGGTMVGTFIQQTSDGAIQFTEHLYLMEEAGTLVLRLKHFNADLTAWEEKDDMLTFRLVAIEPCAAYFHALTLRCADPSAPGEGLVAAVRMKSDKPEPQELIFQFAKLAIAPDTRCPGAATQIEINRCNAKLFNASERRRDVYAEAAVETHLDNDQMVTRIRAAEEAFKSYRDLECRAVHRSLGDSDTRTAAMMTCLTDLTDIRTRTIWENWLVNGHNTGLDLPEPGPTR